MSEQPQIPQVKWVPKSPSSNPTGPWLLWKEMEKPQEKIRPGSIVDVSDAFGRWVGRGFYNGHARVRVRLLTLDPAEVIDEAFFTRRIEAARFLREEKLGLPAVTDAYRLIHSESDGLGGLIIDKYGSLLVIQYLSAGMFHWRKVIQSVLLKQMGPVRFYGFADRHVQKQESFDYYAEPLPEPIEITEQGMPFVVSPGLAQKTGFFADQRDNRLRLSKRVEGRRVLDLCCHTGGFAIYAKAIGKADAVDAVDYDADVIRMAKENAALQKLAIQFHQSDLFQWLEAAKQSRRKFDVVILDPPKQTRSVDGVPTALRRYFAMNRAAMDVLEPGGLLVTCSCSGLIREEAFLRTVQQAAERSGRRLESVEITGAAGDHPVLKSLPATQYLKVVWAKVVPLSLRA
jgi:23S rRNA (cytosine1962-C5)-methyltransferase